MSAVHAVVIGRRGTTATNTRAKRTQPFRAPHGALSRSLSDVRNAYTQEENRKMTIDDEPTQARTHPALLSSARRLRELVASDERVYMASLNRESLRKKGEEERGPSRRWSADEHEGQTRKGVHGGLTARSTYVRTVDSIPFTHHFICKAPHLKVKNCMAWHC